MVSDDQYSVVSGEQVLGMLVVDVGKAGTEFKAPFSDVTLVK